MSKVSVGERRVSVELSESQLLSVTVALALVDWQRLLISDAIDLKGDVDAALLVFRDILSP